MQRRDKKTDISLYRTGQYSVKFKKDENGSGRLGINEEERSRIESN